jgi:hypothetical protein
VIRTAEISDCGRYRWRLGRQWDPGLAHATFVMLNPSTADADVDDPTIRRCIGFARAWKLGGIEVVNLFPYRATDPADLVAARESGVDVTCKAIRDRHILRAMSGSYRLIAAWGAHPMAAAAAPSVIALTGGWMCLGHTKAGAPRHPLYMPGGTLPVPL